ncbi:putative ATP-dependent RNA helicase NDAI_0B05110 [Naumovozyma dairenensis CBS 421]|uniref:ATP-dependent RNA helicase n=1 Tax=Naumovozyma dairenensis (strain ATCC 10597 / BCRC 20456 / CBS 421 / NBRC 0211 / NRRL Y-12639) TaxID=1071378 RepID=G0W6Y3_NAUDC|nr:hypothetical protein NDAI_0B05110 [Naumovozyma dairenensis CBS 421]CCD23544.1 hypothetical protein NDAI_0B05110 [Naumovozyma dairenensis CBS 421]
MSSLDDADDGMLLNFVTDDSSTSKSTSNNSQKVTGGRWKDRRKLQMMLDGKKTRGKRSQQDLYKETGDDDEHDEDSKSNKKRSTMNNNNSRNQTLMTNKKTRELDNKLASRKGGVLPPNTASSEIVSSLFTSNREISTAVNTNKHDENIKINPSNAPSMEDSFDALGINDTLVSHLVEKMRITKPTNIQKLAIPNLISSNKKNNDLFIHAQTGSGKTLTYLLPIISSILEMEAHVDRKSGCFALIVAPTRELASQIYQVASTLTNCCHYLVPCLLIGGERKKSEKARLRKGCNFIVGTPGRILDHLQNTKVIREQMGDSLRYLVLDEGDKLMELGFEQTIDDILKIIHEVPINNRKFPKLPSRIINVLCSATLKGRVTKLGDVALQNYKLISVSGKTEKETVTVAPDQLLQQITIVPPKLRLVTLAAELNNMTKRAKENPEQTTRTMVFLSCSDSVEFHFETFSSNDSHHKDIVGDTVRLLTKGNTIFPCFDPAETPKVLCYKLHGSLSQQMRTQTLKHFATDNDATKGKHLIMFCTDVASRGLDLPYVSTVIEVDPPFAAEDHLHRIGRTARAGKPGESLLFLLPGEEEGYMDYIKPYHPLGWQLLKFDEDILKSAFSDLRVARNDITAKDAQRKKSKDKTEKILEWDTNATTWHLNVERRLLEDSTYKNVAMRGYTSHVRAYATHITQEKKFFNVRCLHLGHLAKSFGLRERPKSMGALGSKQQKMEDDAFKNKKKEDPQMKLIRMARKAVRASASEFNY